MVARSVLLILFLALAILPARASEGMEAARDAYARGRFEEAAWLARSLGTSEGNALAARAELAEGDYLAPPSERRARFEQAEKDARAAIALDPQNPEGHLCLALALGFLGRLDGVVAAHFAGYADEARQHIDEALQLAPTNPWANALLGGWNLEIVHQGGLLGQAIYGASLEKGIAAYTYALALDGGNAAIAYQYALQLVALGGAWRRAEARQALSNVLDAEPADASGRFAHQRAERLKRALDTHDERELRAILADQFGADTRKADGATGWPR